MGNRADLGSVRIEFRPQKLPHPNEVIPALVETFGAKITCHDWYDDRRQDALRTIAMREEAGTPFSNPQRLIDDIDRAEGEAGHRFGIAVPMEGGGYMIGDITAQRVVLTACCSLKESETVRAIVAFLRSLDIVAKVDLT
jgi:hypothetical protein